MRCKLLIAVFVAAYSTAQANPNMKQYPKVFPAERLEKAQKAVPLEQRPALSVAGIRSIVKKVRKWISPSEEVNEESRIKFIHNGHGNTEITREDFIKLRCQEIGKPAYMMMRGSMYAEVHKFAPKHLFNFIGVDISRCVEHEGRVWLVSRKVSLYKDPETGETLRHWENPYTHEVLNVLHRSYDYQEFPIPERLNATIVSPNIGFASIDYMTSSRNPLFKIPKYKEYGGREKRVEAINSYKHIFNPKNFSASFETGLSYIRSGSFEPWMKMSKLKGRIVLNYSGSMVAAFEDIDEELKELIENKLPLFREPPRCRTKKAIGTSWSKWERQFDAYLNNEEFPLPAPLRDEECL